MVIKVPGQFITLEGSQSAWTVLLHPGHFEFIKNGSLAEIFFKILHSSLHGRATEWIFLSEKQVDSWVVISDG